MRASTVATNMMTRALFEHSDCFCVHLTCGVDTDGPTAYDLKGGNERKGREKREENMVGEKHRNRARRQAKNRNPKLQRGKRRTLIVYSIVTSGPGLWLWHGIYSV